ncbi:DUF6804 family protein [Agromyces sp. NPDC058104]|uniref:DUF6804 family protein n=1 Tax=Agromyces sp. NPDC058104 TaxID=3346342 RepID=UPI0036D9AA40
MAYWWDDAKPLDSLTDDELTRTQQATLIEHADGSVDLVLAQMYGAGSHRPGIRRLGQLPGRQEIERLLARYGRALKHPMGPWAEMEHGGRIRHGFIWSTEEATRHAIAVAKAAASRETERLWLRGVAIVGAGLLVAATFELDYGYYEFLRWGVFITASIAGFLCAERDKTNWVIGLVAIAILWNPFVPINLTREVWMPLDLVAAGYLALVAFVAAKRETQAQSVEDQ